MVKGFASSRARSITSILTGWALVSCAVDLPSDPALSPIAVAVALAEPPSARPEVTLTLDHWLDTDASRLHDAVIVRAGSARASLDIRWSVVDRTLVARPWEPLRPELAWTLAVQGDALVAVDGAVASDVEPVALRVSDADATSDTPARVPTWDDDVAPLLRDRCAPCHTDDGPLLQMQREALVDRPARSAPDARLILPYDPAGSALLWRVVPGYPEPLGATMPPTWSEQPPLERDDLRMIEAWIRAGAP